jgi:hypothetical protein
MSTRFGLVLVAVVLTVSGCSTLRNIVGFPSPGEPAVSLKAAETRWLLVKNSRFGDVPSEPEYVWVEDDKRPWTFRWGIPTRAALAPPEIVAQYGRPPGGGRISPKQGMPYQVTSAAGPPAAVGAPSTGQAALAAPPPAPLTKRGWVVWADTNRIVIDLTARDGLRPGSIVSLRRDRIPIVHPVTGEVLGELDEEVATARVTELREKFSVAEIQAVAPGAQVQVRDRVVPK